MQKKTKRIISTLLMLVFLLSGMSQALAASVITAPESTGEISEEQLASEYSQYEKVATQIALGGMPNGLDVMFMGEYVLFEDVKPEFLNNRVMIPVRTVMEFLGADVKYTKQKDAVSIAFENGDELYFEVGNTEITLKSDDGEKTILMDVAPFIKNNQTYVPVRFFSEICGFEVSWDSNYRTVVIADKEALVSDLDAKLTIINEILFAQTWEPEKTYKETVDIKADIIPLGSADEDNSISLFISMIALINDGIIDMSVEYDISELFIMLVGSMGAAAELMGLEFETDEGMFEESEFDIIVNTLTEYVYYHSSMPAGADISGGDDSAASTDTWVEISIADISDFIAEFLSIAKDMTVGELMYRIIMNNMDITSVASFEAAANAAVLLFGDDCFTTSGTDKELTLTTDDITEVFLTEYVGNEFFMEIPDTIDMEITISKENGIEMTLVSKIDEESDDINNEDSNIWFSMKLTGNKKNGFLTMELHINNQVKILATVTTAVVETDEKPRSQPPEGAVIIDGSGSIPDMETLLAISQMSSTLDLES